MRVGEAARRAGVTVRALRYYEKLGLVTPRRSGNEYREYEPLDVALVQEIKGLMDLGFAVSDTKPFLECLLAGNARADVCPESLAAYQRAIDDLTDRIERFAERRAALVACLDAAIGMVPGSKSEGISLDGPWPPVADRSAKDAAAAWRWPLAGRRMPPLELPSTDGETVSLGEPSEGRTVIYLYPLTGSPLADLPKGWNSIPGARGCTAEACNFRDHHRELLDAGARRVFGLSSQSTTYQREVVRRLRLPFAMLSDERLALAEAMGLPTFEADGMRLFHRLTLIVRRGVVEHAFYPVDAPQQHALEVMEWLRSHPER